MRGRKRRVLEEGLLRECVSLPFRVDKMEKSRAYLHPYFPGREYHTSHDSKKKGLFGGTRPDFTLRFLRLVLRNRKRVKKGIYDTALWAASSLEVLRLIERCGGRFHITGLEHILEAEPPVVYISNHMSTLETMVFPCIIAPVMDVTFVVKESLVSHPLFGPIMRSRDPVVVGRKDPRADFTVVIEQGRRLLEGGRSVVIFPQSTRTTRFVPAEFNSLGIKLARAAGVKVVPVAIRTDFWSSGKLIRDLGPLYPERPIHMSFGEAFSVEKSGREAHQKVVEYIRHHLEEWYSQ
ncbi:MAG: lysophospholipid acyltransferase family protein [Bacteroidales bacterium]